MWRRTTTRKICCGTTIDFIPPLPSFDVADAPKEEIEFSIIRDTAGSDELNEAGPNANRHRLVADVGNDREADTLIIFAVTSKCRVQKLSFSDDRRKM